MGTAPELSVWKQKKKMSDFIRHESFNTYQLLSTLGIVVAIVRAGTQKTVQRASYRHFLVSHPKGWTPRDDPIIARLLLAVQVIIPVPLRPLDNPVTTKTVRQTGITYTAW